MTLAESFTKYPWMNIRGKNFGEGSNPQQIFSTSGDDAGQSAGWYVGDTSNQIPNYNPVTQTYRVSRSTPEGDQAYQDYDLWGNPVGEVMVKVQAANFAEEMGGPPGGQMSFKDVPYSQLGGDLGKNAAGFGFSRLPTQMSSFMGGSDLSTIGKMAAAAYGGGALLGGAGAGAGAGAMDVLGGAESLSGASAGAGDVLGGAESLSGAAGTLPPAAAAPGFTDFSPPGILPPAAPAPGFTDFNAATPGMGSGVDQYGAPLTAAGTASGSGLPGGLPTPGVSLPGSGGSGGGGTPAPGAGGGGTGGGISLPGFDMNTGINLAGIFAALNTLLRGNQDYTGGAADSLRAQAATQQGRADDLWDLGRDPQNQLHDYMRTMTSQGARGADSARGIAMGPASSGNENEALRNFEMGWQNNQLNRATTGFNAGLLPTQTTAASGTLSLGQNNIRSRENANAIQALLSGARGLGTPQTPGGAPPSTNADPYSGIGNWLNQMWNDYSTFGSGGASQPWSGDTGWGGVGSAAY